jgi:DNA-binding NarL/FixJ family response regulator
MRRITAWGLTKTASEWARDPRAEVSVEVIRRRLAAGWLPEDAITTGKKQEPRSKRRPRPIPVGKPGTRPRVCLTPRDEYLIHKHAANLTVAEMCERLYLNPRTVRAYCEERGLSL